MYRDQITDDNRIGGFVDSDDGRFRVHDHRGGFGDAAIGPVPPPVVRNTVSRWPARRP